MITYPSLQTATFEQARLDKNKPILFIDVDGVINPLPYERVWIGPEGPVNDFMLWDPKNWRWDKLSMDPTLHFPITREFDVKLDRWADQSTEYKKHLQETQADKQYKALKISVSDVMLSELRSIIQEFDLQVVFLTYWKSEALRILEPEINLGATSFLDWFTGSDLGHAMKVHALSSLYEESELRAPFIFIDDEALRGLHSHSPLWHENPHNSEQSLIAQELNTLSKLFIQPDTRWGIEPAHLKEMRSFLESL